VPALTTKKMQKTLKSNSRILYADILRIITMFVVVLFHVCTDRWYGCFDNPSEWYVLNFFVAGLRWCVPMFFMLSGMNFLDPERNMSYKKLFTKSIPHILCALIFWSILYKSLAVATNHFLGLKTITSDSIIAVFTTFIFQESWFHLWFLYPLLGMYVLTPAIRIFTKNASKKDFVYLLGLYFIFAWFLPTIFTYTGWRIAFKVQDLAVYTGYFIAGYFLAKYDLTKIQTRTLYIVGALLWVLTIVVHITMSVINRGSMFPNFFFYGSFNIGITAFFIFVLVKNTVNNSKIRERFQDNKFITLLSGCSFGIYLTHAIFLNVFGGLLHINTSSFPAILSVPVLAILVFTCSFGLTFIIKKIPILNKWIV